MSTPKNEEGEEDEDNGWSTQANSIAQPVVRGQQRSSSFNTKRLAKNAQRHPWTEDNKRPRANSTARDDKGCEPTIAVPPWRQKQQRKEPEKPTVDNRKSRKEPDRPVHKRRRQESSDPESSSSSYSYSSSEESDSSSELPAKKSRTRKKAPRRVVNPRKQPRRGRKSEKRKKSRRRKKNNEPRIPPALRGVPSHGQGTGCFGNQWPGYQPMGHIWQPAGAPSCGRYVIGCQPFA